MHFRVIAVIIVSVILLVAGAIQLLNDQVTLGMGILVVGLIVTILGFFLIRTRTPASDQSSVVTKTTTTASE